MTRITHPIHREGVVKSHFGVVFTDGVADVDLTGRPNQEAFYRNRGYGIEDAKAPLKADLLDQARALGIDAKDKWTVDQINAAIADHATPTIPGGEA
jgi:hypothetical protein